MKRIFGRSGKRPTVGCDAVVFRSAGAMIEVLLIKRGHEPFKGKWALPGGFMERNESCEQAVKRELQEETGLKKIKLQQIGAFSKPGRDPRGTIISVSYMGFAPANAIAKGSDDAVEAKWFPVKKHPKMAFDHELILKTALQRMGDM
jgi:8-oxo-dGTP diphosphatase